MTSECRIIASNRLELFSSDRCNLLDARKVFDEMRKRRCFVELHGFWVFRRNNKWISQLSCLMSKFQTGDPLPLNSSSSSKDPLLVSVMLWYGGFRSVIFKYDLSPFLKKKRKEGYCSAMETTSLNFLNSISFSISIHLLKLVQRSFNNVYINLFTFYFILLNVNNFSEWISIPIH
jgi:hypothetical protein